MLLLAICAAMATEVLLVSAGLHLLLLRVRWDETLPGTFRKQMRLAKPPGQLVIREEGQEQELLDDTQHLHQASATLGLPVYEGAF